MGERNVDHLLDPPGLRRHHHGAVAQEQRLVDRMGDVDHRLAGLLPDAHQLGLQDHPVLRVERRERLVHQQHAGIGDEGARDRAALAHAAGQLVRIMVAELGKPDELQGRRHPRGGYRPRHTARHQPEADVLRDAHPWKEPAVLKHHGVGDRPAGGIDARDPAGGVIEAGQDAQQGRLAAAARADDADELARRDLQVDVLERDHAAGAAAVDLAQRRDLDRRTLALNHAVPQLSSFTSPRSHPKSGLPDFGTIGGPKSDKSDFG